MPEETAVKPNDQDTNQTAESENTETQEEGIKIPKYRFDEINEKYKEADKRAQAAEKALREAQEARLKEKEDYKALYEQTTSKLSELEPKAQQLEAYQETLQSVLNAQIADIPEELHALIPEEMSVQQKLAWIARNRAYLMKPAGPDIGAGTRGAGGESAYKLTTEEKQAAKLFGLSDEEYVKYKDKDDA